MMNEAVFLFILGLVILVFQTFAYVCIQDVELLYFGVFYFVVLSIASFVNWYEDRVQSSIEEKRDGK